MNIGFCIRPDYLLQTSGDTVQLLKTKKYLERNYHCKISILTSANEINSTYDLVHIFNLQTHKLSEAFVRKAKKLNIKIAFSTIFWDLHYAVAYDFLLRYLKIIDPKYLNLYGLKFLLQNFSKIIGKPLYYSNNYINSIKFMIDNSDVLLPNSEEEITCIVNHIKADIDSIKRKSMVVFNSVDTIEPDQAGKRNNKKSKELMKTLKLPQEYILCVGRIEPIKNQYSIIKAMEQEDIPLVFAGDKESNPSYFNYLLTKTNNKNIYFIGQVPHENLMEIYKNALVHVLPSFRESPGLASIEALANGCKCVVSNEKFCPVKTYFGNNVTVIDPTKIYSLYKGILSEIEEKRDLTEISKIAKGRFNWEITAQQTYAAYKKILDL
jgi:glycosyltransferase involved in cell wall biosynthesis